MSNARDWIMVAAFAATVGAGFALITQSPWPTCDGHDPERQVFSIVVGGSMLLAGCEPRLIYRNDGSVTPP